MIMKIDLPYQHMIMYLGIVLYRCGTTWVLYRWRGLVAYVPFVSFWIVGPCFLKVSLEAHLILVAMRFEIPIKNGDQSS